MYDLHGVAQMGRQSRLADPVYRSMIAVGERLLRELQWQTEGRVPAPGDLLLAERGADCDRSLANYLQPRPAALVTRLPTARARQLPGSGLPATHGRDHAVTSQLARSKISFRSRDAESFQLRL